MPLWVPQYQPQRGNFKCTTLTTVDFGGATTKDVTGATVSITSVYPHAKLTVVSFWDVDYKAVGSANVPVLGKLNVDTVEQSHTMITGPDPSGAAGAQRITAGQVWPDIDIPTAKTFTVKGTVAPAATGVNAADVNTAHTKFSWILWDYPGQS